MNRETSLPFMTSQRVDLRNSVSLKAEGEEEEEEEDGLVSLLGSHFRDWRSTKEVRRRKCLF